jgi:membrane protein implicated in regulation of membrane protease activity
MHHQAATAMSPLHRSVLILAALPTSAVISTLVFLPLEGNWLWRLVIAAGVFVGSEILLAHAASRIPARVGPEAMIGRNVKVLCDFAVGECGSCSGYVRLDGERWQARVVAPLPALPETGDQLKVEGVEGLTLLVSPTFSRL